MRYLRLMTVTVIAACFGLSAAIAQDGARDISTNSSLPGDLRGAPFDQGFEDLAALLGAGWEIINTSDDVAGATNPVWFQGNDGVFPAHEGASTSYVAANFNATGGSAISMWLVVPDMGFIQSASFFTQTAGTAFPDNMQVRHSAVGGNNVGTDPMTVGDFTALLLDIDPGLTGNYPDVWTQFTVNPNSAGRMAFRYFVPTSAGPLGTNSNYIGVDSLDLVLGPPPPPEPVPTLSLAGLVLMAGAIGLFAMVVVRRQS